MNSDRNSEHSLLQQTIDQVIDPPPDKRLFFLQGPAGTGKTTLAVRRMRQLVQRGIPAGSILVWVPQRTLGKPYYDALWELDLPGSQVDVVTVSGLARRMIDLFWPQVAERAGFGHPADLPVFLTLETTQYYMERIVEPYDERGLFDGLSIRRNRLCSQIIDDLNKAALVGFRHTEIAERLKRAWGGESAQKRHYDLAQACASGFRAYCLEHNLLDFSLQIEVFFEHLLVDPAFRQYLFGHYRHLIVDNIEEDSPRAHDLLRQWLPACETALVVMDEQAGYRAFLGADARSAAELRWACQDGLTLTNSWVTSPQVGALGWHLVQSLGDQVAADLLPASPRARPPRDADPTEAFTFSHVNFQPQMLTWAADEIASLIQEQGVPAQEIAVLAPFLGDALRFSLSNALAERNIPARSHRPSRALIDEPAAHCLLTLAPFAYPDWRRCPDRADVAQALMVAIDGLDLVRARLLAEIAYRSHEGRPEFSGFDQVRPAMQQRISFVAGERFERLRHWLAGQVSLHLELDDLIARLFQEVLSRPGFGFYQNLDAGRVTENLIESIYKFRQTVGDTLEPGRLGQEYVEMVDRGVIAATYVASWQLETAGAVQMMPAYTFLMANRPVDVQFWLDIGSSGWWERLNQPLTHPYVLSRRWPEGKVWTDEDEFSTRQLAIGRLLLGLTRRCRKRIYLGIAELSEQGYEQRGPLLQAVQRTLRQQMTQQMAQRGPVET
ncbi:MAG: hypothetical protein JW934_00720 [Anaerolineae bacterium]|nr:hypothetical protein [Anaerolineae bacterium]